MEPQPVNLSTDLHPKPHHSFSFFSLPLHFLPPTNKTQLHNDLKMESNTNPDKIRSKMKSPTKETPEKVQKKTMLDGEWKEDRW